MPRHLYCADWPGVTNDCSIMGDIIKRGKHPFLDLPKAFATWTGAVVGIAQPGFGSRARDVFPQHSLPFAHMHFEEPGIKFQRKVLVRRESERQFAAAQSGA